MAVVHLQVRLGELAGERVASAVELRLDRAGGDVVLA